jgi:hypothetical protein
MCGGRQTDATERRYNRSGRGGKAEPAERVAEERYRESVVSIQSTMLSWKPPIRKYGIKRRIVGIVESQ